MNSDNKPSWEIWKTHKTVKSNYWKCSVKECVHRNSAKLTGKHLCHSFFFNKVVDQRPATLAPFFSCEFCEIFKNIFFYRRPPDDCYWTVIFSKQLWMTASAKQSRRIKGFVEAKWCGMHFGFFKVNNKMITKIRFSGLYK